MPGQAQGSVSIASDVFSLFISWRSSSDVHTNASTPASLAAISHLHGEGGKKKGKERL